MSADLLETLRALESELHHDGQLCTPERLDALLHPAFREVGRSGRPYTRETVIGYLATLATAPASASSGHVLQTIGDDGALLTYRSVQRGRDGTDEAALRSSVWQRSAAGWQLVYHQGTPAAE